MPNGLMGYPMPTTATPPMAPPAGRPPGIGGGLFGGGTPYPVDPSMQQGLMQDAWRQFGLQLLANSQNVNVGQGLAGALQAGRQAYAGGAREAYQVVREQEQDRTAQEYRRAQTEYYQSRAETEAAEAQAARDAAEAKEQGVQALIERIDKNPFLSPAQKEASKLRLLSGAGLTDAGLLPQEADEPAQPEYRSGASPLLRVNPDGSIETVYTPPATPAGAAGGAPDQSAIFKRIAQLVNDGLSPGQAQRVVVQELAASRAALAPPESPTREGMQVDPVMTAAIAAQRGVQPGSAAGTPPDSREQPQTPSPSDLRAAGIDPSILQDEEALAELMGLLKTKTLAQIAGGG